VNQMKQRPIIICLVVLVLGSVLFWLQSNYIITGWLNGEAFYQGRPTSYWRRDLDNVRYFVRGWGSMDGWEGFYRRRKRSWLASIMGTPPYRLRYCERLECHPLWTGDPAARDVLRELVVDSAAPFDPVREFAKEGLARIKQ
jgi:hypothetical protein